MGLHTEMARSHSRSALPPPPHTTPVEEKENGVDGLDPLLRTIARLVTLDSRRLLEMLLTRHIHRWPLDLVVDVGNDGNSVALSVVTWG